VQDFHQLKAWQLSRLLNVDVAAALSPRACRRRPTLRLQALKAVQSVSDNIAEGAGRGTNKDFSHFLDQSLGSLGELESQLIRALDAKIIELKTYQRLRSRTIVQRRMVLRLQARLKE
jgi:four helix bundle protein